MWASVKLSVLPGSVRGVGSGAAGCAGTPGAPAGGAGGMAYAHAGGSPAARSTPAVRIAATPRTRTPKTVRMMMSLPFRALLWTQSGRRAHELLHAPVLRLQRRDFSDVEVSLRIGGHVVERAELARRRAPLPERIEELERLAVRRPSPWPGSCCRRTGTAAPDRSRTPCWRRRAVAAFRRLAFAADEDLRHVFAVEREHLHALAAAVGDIDEPVIRHARGVHRLHELRRALVGRRRAGAGIGRHRRSGRCRTRPTSA